MKAAVVNTFGVSLSFEDFRNPQMSEDEIVVKVLATALSPIVRALASGKHYASSKAAGFVPGVDGIGVGKDGHRVYFLFPKAPFASWLNNHWSQTRW